MANEIQVGPQVLFGNANTPISSTSISSTNTVELIKVVPGTGYLFNNPNNGSIPQITAIENNAGYIYNSKTVQNLPAWFKLGGTSSGAVALPTPTLTATPVSATQINLSVPTNANAVSYRFEQFNGTSWDILQNTGTATKSVTNLTASTAYQFRVKYIGDGTNYADSPYGTANATTTAATDFFYDDGSGPAGTYTSPDAGVTSGTITRDGNGKIVFAPSGYSTLQVNGTKPVNRKIAATVFALDVETDETNQPENVQIILKGTSNLSAYTLALGKRISTTQMIFRILTEAGEQAVSAAINVAPPFLFRANINAGVITLYYNDTLVPNTTYTDSTANLNYANIQTPNGATFDDIRVTAL